MRLELNQGWYRCRSYIFQFHKGAIRTISTPWVLPECRNFNSIKVRLEHGWLQHRITFKLLFQFHKGAIRTSFPSLPFAILGYFNSIKVRLEHVANVPIRVRPNFNSIKVRLEPPQRKEMSQLKKFQFHKGAIRTLFWLQKINKLSLISIP